ncbi:MAG: cysteine--tRNA ligase [Clostridia bacterium]|nr:cysteine--tRNA ligase [Clostridia bacterium]
MQVFNSQTRKKETLVPLEEGKIRMYVCGPTVYDYFHIGNARPFIVFDVLRRYLEHRGYEVTFVQNFTDIDDKMIRRANEEGITVKELGDRFIREYRKDAAALGIRPATIHPRATEHIKEIIDMVRTLEEKGYAYELDGDVYFSVDKFPGYGKLSGQSLDSLESGARVDVDTGKRNPADFALWKAAKPGEPSWDSPWGKGRPGWHIECSAMSRKYLGDTFDIHAGGKDLLFPHHENEVAQSECCTGKTFARYWMHNGFINIDNEKMSKSKGNFFTVRDIMKEYQPEDIRMFMLSAHYRSPVNFSRDMMAQAHTSLQRILTAEDNLRFMLEHSADKPLTEADNALAAAMDDCARHFDEAMDDDMNTADAIGAIFDLVRLINTNLSAESPKALLIKADSVLTALTDVLGLKKAGADDALPAEVQALLDARAVARKARVWAESDRLRDELKARGYAVEDTAQGQKVKKI